VHDVFARLQQFGEVLTEPIKALERLAEDVRPVLERFAEDVQPIAEAIVREHQKQILARSLPSDEPKPGHLAMLVVEEERSRYLDPFIDRYVGMRPGYEVWDVRNNPPRPVTREELREALVRIVKASMERPILDFGSGENWLLDFDEPRFRSYAFRAIENEIKRMRREEDEAYLDTVDTEDFDYHEDSDANFQEKYVDREADRDRQAHMRRVVEHVARNGAPVSRVQARAFQQALERGLTLEEFAREIGGWGTYSNFRKTIERAEKKFPKNAS